MSYRKYIEVQPERAIQGNFSSGQFSFKWDLGAETSWCPCKSFVRFRATLSRGNANRDQLTPADGVAPNYYFCDTLFQQVCQKINGKTVGYVNDYVAQCAALKHRMYKSMNAKEALMSTLNYAAIDHGTRQQAILAQGRVADVQESYLGAEGLGFDVGTNQLAIANTGILTVTQNGGAALPDLRSIFAPGDIIRINNANCNFFDYQVEEVLTAATMQLSLSSGNVLAAVGAQNITAEVTRIRKTTLTQRSKNFEALWRPAIGFWSIDELLPGGAQYQLLLTPHSDSLVQRYGVEALGGKLPGDDLTTYKLEITDVQMYLYCEVGKKAGSSSHSFEEVACSSQSITSSSLTSKEFDVRESNTGVTIAFQDADAGNRTDFSRTKFRVRDNWEKSLLQYYIQKDGIQLPDPIPALGNELGKPFITQRYYENMAYSDTEDLEKVETLEQYLEAGLYFHHEYAAGLHRTSNIHVYTQFQTALPAPLPQILMFDHHITSLKINANAGKVSSVDFS